MECEVCGKQFRSAYYVARHKRQVHKMTIGRLKRGPCGDQTTRFVCLICNADWTRKTNLNKHLIQVHGLPSITSSTLSFTSLRCPYEFCGKEFDGLRKNVAVEVRSHIIKQHSVANLALLEKQFSSLQEFQEWKSEEERIEKVKFSQTRGSLKGANRTVFHFYCNRTRRLLRASHSNRPSFCPAKIKACVESSTGMVAVKYFNIHVGHTHQSSPVTSDRLSMIEESPSSLMDDVISISSDDTDDSDGEHSLVTYSDNMSQLETVFEQNKQKQQLE